MPEIGTKRQIEIFNKLERYFAKKGYEYLGYNGQNDDSHKFGITGTDPKRGRICCYVQYISVRAWRRPPESLKVVVRQNQRNENVEEFNIGNDWFGQGSRHVFIIPGDKESYNKALRLINTI